MAQQVYCRNVYCKHVSKRKSTKTMKNKKPLFKCTKPVIIFSAAVLEVGDMDRKDWGDYLQCLYFEPVENEEEDKE